MLAHLVPPLFEQLIHALEAPTARFRNHDENIRQRDQTPRREEYEGSPLVHRREDGRGGLGDGKEKQPMETLGEGAAEGSDSVRPKLGAKEIWQTVETCL